MQRSGKEDSTRQRWRQTEGERERETERQRDRERERKREREYMYIEDMHVMHSACCNDSRYHYLVLEFI